MLATLILATVTGVDVAQAEPPQEAQPGQCFGRVRYPDAVEIEHARVRVRGPGLYRRTSRAQFRTVASRVLARPAHTVTVEAPARYRSITRIVTTPGAPRRVSVPARYRVERTRIEVSPARLVWVRRSGAPHFSEVSPGQTELTPTGEVLCRVRAAARYVTRTRRLLVSPARRIEVPGPATRRRVGERVLIAPAHTVVRSELATYRIVYRTVTVRPAYSTWVSTPPVWRDVAREHRAARSGWAQVVCPGGLAPWAIQLLQSGLIARGYDAGPADGQARPQTYEALRRFQTDHGLAVGQITVESARALGVVP